MFLAQSFRNHIMSYFYIFQEYRFTQMKRQRTAGGCDQWTPDLVQCYNMGQDGFDAAWKCEASMPNGYTFSSIEVGTYVWYMLYHSSTGAASQPVP